MKSKEEILSSNEFDVHYYGGGRKDILEAMEQYAKEVAIDYAHWILAKMSLVKSDAPEGEREQLFDVYIKEKE